MISKFKKVNTIFQMYELAPTDWDVRKLGDFATQSTERFSNKFKAPILSMTKHRGFVKSLEYFSKQIFSNDISNYKLVKKGNFAYATIHLDEGSIGLLKDFENGYVSPMYTVFQVNSTIDPDYLILLMKTKSYLYKYDAIGEGTVNRRKSVKFSDLSKLKIPLPPLLEQQKIASILSNVDNLIESTGKVITHSKKVKTGLMQKLLTRGIGHTKFKKVPWLFGKEIEIPEEWECVDVEYVSDKLLSGGTPSTIIPEYWEGNIPWTKGAVLTTNITIKGERLISELGLKNSSTSIIPKDNLLVVSRVSIGNVSINKIDIAINQDITAVILNKTICLTEFLYWNLLQTLSILVSFSQGTTIQGFTRKDLSSHKVLLPPLPEQQKIASILSNIDSKITSQEQYKEKLLLLKKSLMQKLLTGEVRV